MQSTFPSSPPRRAVAAASFICFGLLPLLAVALVVADLVSGGAGWAFREAFSGAAEALRHGDELYPALDDPALAHGVAYVYPPLLAVLSVPLASLPGEGGVVVFAAVLIAAVFGTLAVLGVRDWRCYGIAFAWPPVLSAIHVENVTILLGLAAALTWRFRDRPVVGGVALGVSFVVKPLLWPLALWLAVTRRRGAVVWCVISALALGLASWALIAFDGLVSYPALLRRLGELMDEWGYSVYALALDAGAGEGAARVVWLVSAGALVCAVVLVARRGDERRAFGLAVVASIACSPVVWMHYFALLLVVVAVLQPRLGPAWFVPLLMFGGEEIGNGAAAQTALVLGAAALTVLLALRPGSLQRVPRLAATPASGPGWPATWRRTARSR